MSPKTSGGDGRAPGGRAPGAVTPARVVGALLGALVLIFVFQNTGTTEIQLLASEISMPLWLALLGTGVVGAVCGALFAWRRR
ncbi:hypothetical protein GCM10019016_117370 [Streptomyces prasinosporus]|uniref:Lipopolysaccharide assembly protein A domain-containing protein n=1 Tax=Streptomyces prasinosporus TaxID=68256 RepID=A0ABP6UCF8_9ACTN